MPLRAPRATMFWKLVTLPDKKLTGLSRSAPGLLGSSVSAMALFVGSMFSRLRSDGPGGRLRELSKDAIKNICLAYSKQVQHTILGLCLAYSRQIQQINTIIDSGLCSVVQSQNGNGTRPQHVNGCARASGSMMRPFSNRYRVTPGNLAAEHLSHRLDEYAAAATAANCLKRQIPTICFCMYPDRRD